MNRDRDFLQTITMFSLVLALGASLSAATGHQTLVISPREAVGGRNIPLPQEQQQEDDNDLPFRAAGFSSSAASSIESAVPEWVNLRPDKDNAADESDDTGNDAEEWREVPISPLLSPGEDSFQYDRPGGRRDTPGSRNSVLLEQQRPFPYNKNFNNGLMLPTSEDLKAIRHYYHIGNGAVGSSLIKQGDNLKRIYLTAKLREQQAAALPSASTWLVKSNYRVPAESNIVRENFDKRSPRCIANCMKQGLVHPIQCHSLCRKR